MNFSTILHTIQLCWATAHRFALHTKLLVYVTNEHYTFLSVSSLCFMFYLRDYKNWLRIQPYTECVCGVLRLVLIAADLSRLPYCCCSSWWCIANVLLMRTTPYRRGHIGWMQLNRPSLSLASTKVWNSSASTPHNVQQIVYGVRFFFIRRSTLSISMTINWNMFACYG